MVSNFGSASEMNDTIQKDSLVYYEDVPSKFFISQYISAQLMNLNFVCNDTSKYINGKKPPALIYNPVVAGGTGLDIAYKKYRVAFGLSLPNKNKPDSLFGTTDYIDFRIVSYYTRFGYDLYFQRYSGFYYEDPAIIDTGGVVHQRITRPDLTLFGFGFNAYYIFSKKLSLGASFKQTGRQVRTAGAFLSMLSYYYSGINSNGHLVPEDRLYDFYHVRNLKGGRFNTLVISPGYALSIVKNKFFVTGVLFTGLGYQYQQIEFLNDYLERSSPSFKFNLRLSSGYNGDFFFADVNFSVDFNTIPIQKTDVNIMMYMFRTSVGFRF